MIPDACGGRGNGEKGAVGLARARSGEGVGRGAWGGEQWGGLDAEGGNEEGETGRGERGNRW